MDTRLTVHVSSAKVENLSKQQLRLVNELKARIEQKGFRVVEDSATTDRIEERLNKVRNCQGVVILALAQWTGRRLYRNSKKEVIFPSEFSHINGVLGAAAERPMLVLREKSVAERGVLRRGYLHATVDLPGSLDPGWLDSSEFQNDFTKWASQVNEFRHVFLGYSSQAEDVGNRVSKFLTEKLGLRVFDWHDFRRSAFIWESIETAERLTRCGVFLFMADDSVVTPDGLKAAPRDNVIYEAGYFAGAKGRSLSLIVCEEGAKIPSDLGGILLLQLTSRNDIGPVETRLREELERMLAASP